jgi:cob(I)alamin adenosyltransferase
VNWDSIVGWVLVVSNSTLQNKLKNIQQDLFNIGGELSLPDENINLIKINRLAWLESEINVINKKLPPLKEFILPNGSELCTRIHIARTECRNAERDIVKLSEREEIPSLHIKYLNRLSDYFFVLAREVQLESNDNEIH